jgi:hypothetical protein
MNSFPRLLSAFAIVALCALASARGAVAPRQPAPDFTVTDIAGKTHRLSVYRGLIVVLEWVNPSCTYVVRHYRSGNLPATQAAAAEEGAVWLQINSMAMGDLEVEKTLEWQKKNGVAAAGYIRDQTGKLGRLYGAQVTPHLCVIAKDGTVAYQGAIDDQPQASVATTSLAHNYVKAALAALKAGRPVEKPATEAYGCSIKYASEN